MFKLNNKNTTPKCEICPKLTIKTSSLLLTLNIFYILLNLLLNLSRLMPAVSLCISRKNIKYPKQKLKITTEFLKNEFIFNNNISLCKNNSSTEYFSNFFCFLLLYLHRLETAVRGRLDSLQTVPT